MKNISNAVVMNLFAGARRLPASAVRTARVGDLLSVEGAWNRKGMLLDIEYEAVHGQPVHDGRHGIHDKKIVGSFLCSVLALGSYYSTRAQCVPSKRHSVSTMVIYMMSDGTYKYQTQRSGYKFCEFG